MVIEFIGYHLLLIGTIVGILLSIIPIGTYIYFKNKEFDKIEKEKQDEWNKRFQPEKRDYR